MKIEKTLNLVIPIERDDGTMAHAYAVPLSRQAFDQNFLVIAKTFAAIYNEGLGFTVGPRVAMKMLRRVADQMGQGAAVEAGLVADIKRLTSIVAPGTSGGVPFDLAVQQGVISPEDADEVENAIAFFMLASAMHKRKEAEFILAEAAKLWGARTTSSTITELIASLSTSTPAAATGPKATPSAIPS